jgi:phosphate/sulfate permease
VNAWPRYRRTRPAVIGGILLWWLSTVPIAAILAAIIFHILRAVFG